MANPSKENSASKSIALSFYTFLSRVLGLIRDHYMAVSFGNGWIASAFSVSYRLPNMFRNLLAEGTLSQSFMPLYSDSGKISSVEAKVMSGTVLSFLFFLLSLFVGLFLLLAPYFIPYLVGGTLEYSNLIIELSLILFFLIMTASLSSIFMAISNSKDKFFVPSLSPIILNITYLIVFILVFPFYEELLEKVKILSYGIVVGGIVQLLVQAFFVYKLGLFPKINLNWKHPAIVKIFKLMLPAVIGGGFYQISLLVDIFLANYIQNNNPGLGAVVSLDYSQRLIQFPTGIIGVALATTTLPTLLASLKKNEIHLIPEELANVISFSLFLTIPSALGFMIMGRTMIDSIYFGGKWDLKATETTIYALQFYSFAIPMFSINKVLTSSFYAFKNTSYPLRVNAISFSINILMNLILMNFLKHAGLALSSAISSTITFILLFRGMTQHSITIPHKLILTKLTKMIVPIFLLSVWLILVQNYLYDYLLIIFKEYGIGHANSSRIILVIGIIPSMLFYFAGSIFFKVEEFELISNKFLKRFKR